MLFSLSGLRASTVYFSFSLDVLVGNGSKRKTWIGSGDIYMTQECQENRLRQRVRTGSHHYRAFVGDVKTYDLVSAMEFNLLTFLGLRERHYLLDIGCGSLRGGKLFITYLLPGRYFGIEPERWLIEEGIRNEVGEDLLTLKQPSFNNDNNFTLSVFERKFDFIIAQSIFSHASESQIRRCLSEAKKVLKASSFFAATFVEGGNSYTGNKWVYPGCVTYTLEHMVRLVQEHGLICKPIDWPHPGQQKWVVIVEPGNEKHIPDLSDTIKWAYLENELRFYKKRLSRIQRHRSVRIALRISHLLKWPRRLYSCR